MTSHYLRRLFLTGFMCLFAHVNANANTSVTIQLDWIYNAQFAGLYQAIEQGYFDQEGLDVTLLQAPKSVGVVESVVDAKDLRFGVSESSVLLAQRLAGQPIQALAAMLQASPMGWMHLPKTGIDSIADFKGKRIGIHADGEKILGIALAKHGLSLSDVNFVEVGYDPQILVDGQIDIMQAYYIDEFVELQRITGDTGLIELAGDNGYLAYSQVLFTTEDTVNQQPELVHSIISAMRKGWMYALDNKNETIDLILLKWKTDLNRDYQRASLQNLEALVRPQGRDVMPWSNQARWEDMQELLLKYNLLSGEVNLQDFLYKPRG